MERGEGCEGRTRMGGKARIGCEERNYVTRREGGKKIGG